MKKLSREAAWMFERNSRQCSVACRWSGRQAVLLRGEDPSVRKCGAVDKGIWAWEIGRAKFVSWLCIFLAVETWPNFLTATCLGVLICKMGTKMALYLN